MSSIYPSVLFARRRNPYAPYPGTEGGVPEPDPGSTSDLAPMGTADTQARNAFAPSAEVPQIPQGVVSAGMPQIPQAEDEKNVNAPRPTNILGDPIEQRPEYPAMEPYPERVWWRPTRWNDARERAWEARRQDQLGRFKAGEEEYGKELGLAEAARRSDLASQYYRNQPHLSSPYQKMVEGVPHSFAYNLVTGEEQDLGEAPPSSKNVSPSDIAGERGYWLAEAARIRAEAAQAKRPPGQLVQDIDPETGKVTGSRLIDPVDGHTIATYGITMKNPPRPAQPGAERVDVRREQLIKEALARGDDEETLAKTLEVYDRQNNPALRKGREMANQPAGQPHPPLRRTGPAPAAPPEEQRLKPNWVYKSKTHPGQTFTTDAQGNKPPGE